MQLSPDAPLCWKDAKVPMQFENETSCILVRDQIAREVDIDMSARNVILSLQCKKIEEIEEKKPDIKPLSASLAHELNYMTP